MPMVRKLAGWVIVFGLGLLLGPILVGAVAGLTASSDEQARWQSAGILLGAFDEQSPQLALASQDRSWAIRECGHDSGDAVQQLFGEASPPLPADRSWTPFAGYFDLTLWHGSVFRREVLRRRIEALAQGFSPFSLAFLDNCIRRTAFAGLCALRVEAFLEEAGLRGTSSLPSGGPRFDQSRELATICRYLGGLRPRA